MLNTGRYGLLFGAVLLLLNIVSVEAMQSVYVAALILGALSFIVGLVARIAYVFSTEDE